MGAAWGRGREIVGPAIYLAQDASGFVAGAFLLVAGGRAFVDGSLGF